MTRKKNSFVKLLKKIKISIRLSILSIVLFLMLGISAVIVTINYITLNNVLITAAKYSLFYATGKVSEQVSNYFNPLNSNVFTGYHMIVGGIINPKYSDEYSNKFFYFLYRLVADDKNISSLAWGDINGNWYWLHRNQDDTFLGQALIYKKKTVKKIFDTNGKLLSTKESPWIKNTDARTRPWYQQAKQKNISHGLCMNSLTPMTMIEHQENWGFLQLCQYIVAMRNYLVYSARI